MAASYQHNILLFGDSDLLLQTSLQIKTRLDCRASIISDPKKIMPKVFDEMPLMIVMEASSEFEVGLDVLLKIKSDPVLEFIPLIIISDDRLSHPILNLASAYLSGSNEKKKLFFTISTTLIEAHHQLDVNPFTGLPGHHTSLHKLQSAAQVKGPYAVVTFHIRNLQDFSGQYGAVSADELHDRIVGELKNKYNQLTKGKWLLGQLGSNAFILFLPEDCALDFTKDFIDDYERRRHEFIEYCTRPEFVSKKDPLSGKYEYSGEVTISAAVMFLRSGVYNSATDILHSEAVIQRALRAARGSVLVVDQRKKFNDMVTESMLESAYPATQFDNKKSHLGDIATKEQVEFFIREGNIESYFQPIVDYFEHDIFAYEVLSRFIDSDGSFAHPLAIFNGAREHGLVEELDMRCLELALKTYQELGLTSRIFLNLNRETFVKLCDKKNMIQSYGINCRNIVIELTEQSVAGERSQVLRTKKMLDEIGIDVAFDDAGTGEVSFREVAEIKPSFIKFDRALISGITRSPLKQRHVLSMRSFAKGIGAQTIGEGIEMPSEFGYLKEVRMTYAQGYYVSKPSKEPVPKIEKHLG